MDEFISALDLAAAIKSKKISPVEAVKGYLERMDAINPKLNAVIWRRDEELLREAAAAENAVMKGEKLAAFHGVPIPIKDLNNVEGWPTTFGSRAAADYISTHTDTIVERFKSAGFLLMCRTNTPEFGTLPVTENELHGATRNPWNTDHSPGGSSGGSAAAVAAGLAPIGHANDGGGSIRIPAACCGLVGLKPSRGRTNSGPPVASDVMHGGCVEGVVTRTVADTAAVLDHISGFDPNSWYNAPTPERSFTKEVGADPGRLRFAVLADSPTGSPVSAECKAAAESAAALMRDLGHEQVDLTLDLPALVEQVYPSFMTVWNTGSVYWPISDWSKIEPLNAAMRELSRQTDSISYLESLMSMQAASRQICAHWGRDFDVLITPTLGDLPPRIGELLEDMADPMMPLLKSATLVPFTPLFNASGQPAISLPLAWSKSGLPIGVHFVGAPFGESGLLRLASQIEQAAAWHERHPALAA